MRKFLQISGWTTLTVVGVCLTLYLILLAINWRDVPPSAVANQLQRRYDDRPRAKDRDNAFIYALGFAAPLGESPQDHGAQRFAWMAQATPEQPLDRDSDPRGERSISLESRLPELKEFLESCKPGNSKCHAAIEAADGAYEKWLSSESWLLSRYLDLIVRASWQEPAYETEAPLADFAHILSGQQLMLLHARWLIRQGEYSQARSLLEGDQRFWRNVLASAHALISKMIATRALLRHFEIGNTLMREVLPESQSAVVPAG